jgi:type VI secretion system protein ImpH
VPPLVMSKPGEPGAGAGPLLGWNTWMPTSAVTRRRSDADDALFEAEIVEGRS